MGKLTQDRLTLASSTDLDSLVCKCLTATAPFEKLFLVFIVFYLEYDSPSHEPLYTVLDVS